MRRTLEWVCIDFDYTTISIGIIDYLASSTGGAMWIA
jgi:hypothetical protein